MRRRKGLNQKQKKILNKFIRRMKEGSSDNYPFKNQLPYLQAHHLPVKDWAEICSINDYQGLWRDIDNFLQEKTSCF